LELMRGGHDPGAPPVDLGASSGDLGRLGHQKSRLSLLYPAQPSRPAMAAKISIPTKPAASGPMKVSSAITTPMASATTAASAQMKAIPNRAAGTASALPFAAAIALARSISARA